MGGFGSGNRRRLDRKMKTDEALCLDVRSLNKEGVFQNIGCSGQVSWSFDGQKTDTVGFRIEKDHLQLTYNSRRGNDQWLKIEQPIRLDRTQCNFGGERVWLLCPDCGKRVAVLYCIAARFLCRRCNNLVYASKSESYIHRMMRKARKIRSRIGAPYNLTYTAFEKPKHMHWKTFEHLVDEENNTRQAYSVAIAHKLGMIDKDLRE